MTHSRILVNFDPHLNTPLPGVSHISELPILAYYYFAWNKSLKKIYSIIEEHRRIKENLIEVAPQPEEDQRIRYLIPVDDAATLGEEASWVTDSW